MKKILVRIDNVSFDYLIPHANISTLKESVIKILKHQSTNFRIMALRNVSFELQQGEVLAIIGPNGSGKSTLLKLVSRVITPTSGRIQVQGRVAPMLELGAGFDGELTGYENILIYGALLGNSVSEMRRISESIAIWSGVGDAISLPVRTYSTGMFARLAFSIATETRAEIVIIDEILGVGDAEFQEKARIRIKDLIESGTSIILVTHNLNLVEEIATRAIWLVNGEIRMDSSPKDVINAYIEH
jgi:ABC-type polysaccharide/polyol phosphate transport system ATPase subunit